MSKKKQSPTSEFLSESSESSTVTTSESESELSVSEENSNPSTPVDTSESEGLETSFRTLTLDPPILNSTILREKGVTQLYHFTDKSNLDSIKQNGLFSWDHIDQNGIQSVMGSNEDSRRLDKRKGLEDYVRLSFVQNHPMMHAAYKRDSIKQPIILVIDIMVVDLLDVKFSDVNATSNNVIIQNDTNHIQFSIFKKDYFKLSTNEKQYFQAEVLIRNNVPASYIKRSITPNMGRKST
ncbi:hypothetical protein DFA_00042 [Cavenderia fasciculata]|uniref:DarT domain-containing protein n=1 Tax=Cavenderia fasciculata TaxID=261658 RepID=F4PXF5_CACFS|nr:uncharacterized protein DFA_00042 [Cavenderia fasciculata]EGG19465.1 hypothetical protein DFA_00042 [Cavenderia fasciculata]|eukprot:XP_004357759.1 hypothetical protein DFA_00042 [Cavenderia fasciculata]